jgi:hypothetical protein
MRSGLISWRAVSLSNKLIDDKEEKGNLARQSALTVGWLAVRGVNPNYSL